MRRYTVTVDDTPFTVDVAETAADRFDVSVDGRTYEATLEGDEDLPGAVISPVMAGRHDANGVRTDPGTPRAGRGAPTVPEAVGPAARGASPPVDVLGAPMPGVILEVLVAPGTTVRRADPILVLEAMKMRNTIRSPRDALVVDVAVEAGMTVGAGQPLVRLADAAG